jgi:hypothetical protein
LNFDETEKIKIPCHFINDFQGIEDLLKWIEIERSPFELIYLLSLFMQKTSYCKSLCKHPFMSFEFLGVSTRIGGDRNVPK